MGAISRYQVSALTLTGDLGWVLLPNELTCVRRPFVDVVEAERAALAVGDLRAARPERAA